MVTVVDAADVVVAVVAAVAPLFVSFLVAYRQEGIKNVSHAQICSDTCMLYHTYIEVTIIPAVTTSHRIRTPDLPATARG